MTADEFGFRGLPPEQLTTGGIPLINLPNYTSVGIRNFRPQFQQPKTLQVLDTVSMLFGRHAVRAGFEARMKRNVARDTERVLPSYNFSGNFTGNSLADFLLGYANSLSASTVPVGRLAPGGLLGLRAGRLQADAEPDGESRPALRVHDAVLRRRRVPEHQLRSGDRPAGQRDRRRQVHRSIRIATTSRRGSASRGRRFRIAWCCAAATACSTRSRR